MARRTSRKESDTLQAAVLPVRDSVVFPGMVHTLHVVREGSRRAVHESFASARPLFVVSQRDMSVEDPLPSELYRVGTLCDVLQAIPLPDGSLRVALRGLERAEAARFDSKSGLLYGTIERLHGQESASDHTDALVRSATDAFGELLEKSRTIPAEAIETLAQQDSAGGLADAIAHHIQLRAAQKQNILEQLDGSKRLEDVYALLVREIRLLSIQKEISEKVDREFSSAQREHFLREQLHTIQLELESFGEGKSELAALRESIEQSAMPDGPREKALRELSRLERTTATSPEALVIRSYIDWLIAMPWARLSPDRLDLTMAKCVLDDAHYGLHSVKERILDFLAVRQLSQSLRGPILCFVGPPGVGKTSVGRSVADALEREYVSISLGGLRDEAEIRGHRRTYVGALPGRLLQSLRQCGTRNPVIVLDEIDKMAVDSRGDPSSALLEALDPAQNERFSDYYLEVPFDLSAVLFIATANLVENIPHALRDRMEIVRFSSYTERERLQIAERFILPRQREQHGLKEEQFKLAVPALRSLATEYTREAGLRDLERAIGALCRKAARRIAEGKSRCVQITKGALPKLIGHPNYSLSARSTVPEIGTANALVVTEYGGEAIPIEVLFLEASRERPTLRLTGNLGSVMRESAEAAYSFVRTSKEIASPSGNLERDVHIHVPDNAIPKEGPSAGLTIAVALASALTERPVRSNVALTGEVTLRGRVMAVGGIREKLLAAHRTGIDTVILPRANASDLDEVPYEVRQELEIQLVDTIGDAIRIALVQPTNRAAVTV